VSDGLLNASQLPAAQACRRVLLVEDAPEFISLLVPLLEADNFEVAVAETGAAGVESAREHDPDVVLLDVVLPDMSGFEVCRELRSFSSAYVIMLAARVDEVDRVAGLTVGADDYVTKPCSSRELVARIEAMMRRPRPEAASPGGGGEEKSTGVLELGDLSIDHASREVRVDGEEVTLTRIEYELLDTLASNPRMVFTREVLREKVWGPNWYGDDHVVDVHVANLRKKLDAGRPTSFVRTVRGVGYRFGDS
jgi:DNA-binding response OmpR family regulator